MMMQCLDGKSDNILVHCELGFKNAYFVHSVLADGCPQTNLKNLVSAAFMWSFTEIIETENSFYRQV